MSAKGIAVAKAIHHGLFNSKGQRAYLSWQIGAELSDAEAQYDSDSDSWVFVIPSTGSKYVVKLIKLLNIDNLPSIYNVIYNTMTTLPDLTPFQSSGGKLLHYHGESDPSIPTASSDHYWQYVRSVMYPAMSERDSLAALVNCTLQSDGPYPKDNMYTMIYWVENGIKPTALNASIGGGSKEGDVVSLCQWPTRPLFNTSSGFDCVNDARSIETWTYSFPACKVPVY